MKKLLLLLLAVVAGATTAMADDFVELLTNGTCDGSYTGWNVTNGGSGWAIGQDDDGSYFWASSYEECRLEQTVVLSDKGISDSDLDAGNVVCKASAMMRAMHGSPQASKVANVKVEMQDEAGDVLSTITVIDDLGVYLDWTPFEVDPFTLVSGTRKLKYIVRGTSALFWNGTYGPFFKDLSLMAKVTGGSNNPWGENEGGWCGNTNVNGGKNVYYTITTDDNNEEHLTISKSPNAIGDDCSIENYNNKTQPWISVQHYTWGSIINPRGHYLVIEEGVTGIGIDAFHNSSYLKTVVIPASLTNISSSAFLDCHDVTDVYCHADPDNLEWDSRRGDFNRRVLKSTKMHVYTRYVSTYREKFPDANVTFMGDFSENGIIHDCATDGHEWSDWQTVPPSCTADGRQFHYCIYCGLEETDVIPATGHIWDEDVCIICGETRLWRKGFCGELDVNDGKNVSYLLTTDYEGKEFITISKSPDAVGEDCSIRRYRLNNGDPQPWLDVVYQYNGDGSIGGLSFSSHGEYLVIEDGVTGIGREAFYGSYLLKTITIPASVTSIGLQAFFDCDKVEDVYCLADPEKLTWNDSLHDDFNTNSSMLRSTKMHVFSTYLSTYQDKFQYLNVTFVGDLEDFLDGISTIRKTEKEEGAIYNLAGQRLQKMQKGINIIGGKKVFCK